MLYLLETPKGVTLMTMSQLRKLRLREVKGPPKGHSHWQCQDLNLSGGVIPDDKFQTTTQSWVPRQKHLTARSQMCLLPSNHLGAETFVLVEGDRAGILRKTQADPRRRDNPSV